MHIRTKSTLAGERNSMQRIVEREWLDDLPGDNPSALRARDDVRRLNAIMGHAGILAGLLRQYVTSPPKQLADLGAGDGRLLLAVVRKLNWRRLRVVMVDRCSVLKKDTEGAFAELDITLEQKQCDVFDWLRSSPACDVMLANLFLHHFAPEQLSDLLRLVSSSTKCFVACEPRRALFPKLASRCLLFAGCNAVTRHDAPVSVQAGFRGHELSDLWPREGWRRHEFDHGLFSHCFIASNPL